MRFTAAVCSIVLLPLTLLSCTDTPTPPAEENKAIVTAANVAPLAEKSSDAAALKQAFATAFATPVAKVGDDDYTFSPAALYRLKDKWVLLSEGTGPDCHACSGWLSVHYLERTGDGFRLMKGWTDAVPGTSFGGAPDWKVRTDLMAAPVIESEGGGTWQGYSCSVARLTELAADGPKTRADEIPLTYSDAGALVDETKKPHETEGTIAQGQRGKSFTVRYSGSVTRDVSYTLKGDSFAPGQGAGDIPKC